MPAEQFHAFPLASRDRTWDKTTAIPRLRRWASRDGSGDKEQMDWQKYRQVFFWHESGTLTDFGQFKFPYCDIIDEEPHVVRNAVANALARLENSDIPDADKPVVRRVAEQQLERFSEAAANRLSNESDTVWTFGTPTADQMKKINAVAKRPLKAEDVFVFTTKMVGDMIIPYRFIQIHKSLLEIFRDDARRGVAFMLDHPWAGSGRKPAYPYGRSFDAVLRRSEGVAGETWALYGDKYIVRGREKDGVSTDQIIADIEDGVLFDTSIGWGADVYECSICSNDIRDYSKCEHWPGKTYDEQLCYAIAKPPGFLMEESGVFDGAYPTAGVLSQPSSLFERQGSLQPVQELKGLDPGIPLYHIYSRGRLLTLGATHRQKQVVVPEPLAKGGEKAVNDEERVEQEVESSNQSAAISSTTNTYDTAACGEATERGFISPEQAKKILGADYSADEILRFAKDGIQLRNELIEETIKYGIRAQGNEFPAESWRKLLASQSIEDIRNFRATFERQAKEEIPAGRKTTPEARQEAGQSASLPDEAFKM